MITATLLFVLIYMTSCYGICIWKKNNGLVDMFWGMGFVGITCIAFYFNPNRNSSLVVFNFLPILWGIRLSIFLGIRNWGKPEDFRYAKWRKEWGSTFYWRTYLQVHLFQGLFMLWIAIPIIIVNKFAHSAVSYLPIGIGAIISLSGILIEAIADHQKYRFRKNSEDKNAFVQSGLWRYSRHPNYFGELLVWWGIFIFASAFNYWYVSILSPIIITFLLLFVTGIPMLEKKYDDNISYQEYKKKTSALILWWNKNTLRSNENQDA